MSEKEVELDLKCSLCKGIYREPKTLGCLHSFCLECLESYVEGNHSNAQSNCPVCGTSLKVESREQLAILQTDLFLLNALNAHNTLNFFMSQQKNQHQKLMCSDGENEATFYCLDCETCYCEGCATPHKTVKVFKNHQIIPIEEMKDQAQNNSILKSDQQLYCQIHQQKESKLFCEDCKLSICSLCVLQHPSHKILVISEAIVNENQSLNGLINQVGFYFYLVFLSFLVDFQ